MTYNYMLILITMTSLYLCVWKGCAYVSLTFRNGSKLTNMNDNKTEYIPFIPKRYDSLVATSSIRVGGYSIPASTHVTNLGVILDRHYTMSQQVSKIVQSSTYKLRLINVIRTKLTKPVAERVVNAMVTNNLDYCIWNFW